MRPVARRMSMHFTKGAGAQSTNVLTEGVSGPLPLCDGAFRLRMDSRN